MSEAGAGGVPLALRNVGRVYRSPAGDLAVLQGADLELRAGEIVALVAPSGTGKSTLLHLAGLLERPDSGTVMVGGVDAGGLPDAGRTRIRRDRIGFVYQFHHLLAEFSALENVALPQMIAGVPRAAGACACGHPAGRVRAGGARGAATGQIVRWRTAARGDRARAGEPAGR